MKNILTMIRRWNEFRKYQLDFEKLQVMCNSEDMKRWLLLPQGSAYLNILIELLQNETKCVFQSGANINSYEDFMYHKGRVSILAALIVKIKEAVMKKGE